jgi:hypothetical protein
MNWAVSNACLIPTFPCINKKDASISTYSVIVEAWMDVCLVWIFWKIKSDAGCSSSKGTGGKFQAATSFTVHPNSLWGHTVHETWPIVPVSLRHRTGCGLDCCHGHRPPLLENLAGETNSQYSKMGLFSIMPHGTSCSVLPGIAWA